MLTFSEDLIDFLREHIDLIEEDNFKELYKEVCNEEVKAVWGGELTDLLFAANINPLLYMDSVPQDFGNSSTMTSITLPSNITNLASGAFQYATKLENITLPRSVKTIGARAFSDCARLKSIAIPHGVIDIPMSLFDSCVGLKFIMLPETVQRINWSCINNHNKDLQIRFYGTKEEWLKIKHYFASFADQVPIICNDVIVRFDDEEDIWREV